jgi:hypothetical protein
MIFKFVRHLWSPPNLSEIDLIDFTSLLIQDPFEAVSTWRPLRLYRKEVKSVEKAAGDIVFSQAGAT